MSLETTVQSRVQNAVVYLSIVWVNGDNSEIDDALADALGEVDYRELAGSLSGIVQYLAEALATYESQAWDESRDGRMVLQDLASQVAALDEG